MPRLRSSAPPRENEDSTPDSLAPVDLPLMVGAYACLPRERSDQAQLYTGLAERGLATALEIPDTHVLGVADADLAWLTGQLRGRFTQSAVTALPGTMKRQATAPGFGLASAQEDLRRAAVDFIQELRRTAEHLNQTTAEESISVLQIHSAPPGKGTAEAFCRSLEDLARGHWSTRLVVEHCDGRNHRFRGEKRFLGIDDEIRIVRDHGIGLAINWGRSALEGRGPDLPLAHIRQTAAEGVLEGVIFSGTGDSSNTYGAAWADTHLPLQKDEPTSLMDSTAVAACARDAGPVIRYLGVKVQAPAPADVCQRLDLVESVVAALRSA